MCCPSTPGGEPQRHRGTEKTQSRAHRKHEDTKTRRPSQRQPPGHREKPQITQIDADGLARDSSTWRGPNRRRTTAGEKRGDDERLRPKLTCFSLAGGDRQIAACSAGTFRHCRITSVRSSASICVICGFSVACVDGLCAFVSSCLRCPLCFSLCSSVPLWFNTLARGHGNGDGCIKIGRQQRC